MSATLWWEACQTLLSCCIVLSGGGGGEWEWEVGKDGKRLDQVPSLEDALVFLVRGGRLV